MLLQRSKLPHHYAHSLSASRAPHHFKDTGELKRARVFRPCMLQQLRHRPVWRLGSVDQDADSQQESQQEGQQVEPELLPTAAKWPASPLFFLAAASSFAAIFTDLFAPWGARFLFNNVDKPMHEWVVSHIPKFVRDMVFELGISNVPIVLGCVGWAIATSLLISDALDERQELAGVAGTASKQSYDKLGPKNLKRTAAVWALYWSAGGFLVPGDNLLVHFIKHSVNRARPSTRLKSFSFPSGHSTAVTFIIGMLLFAFLPWLLEVVDRRLREKNKSAKLGVLKNKNLQQLAKSCVRNGGLLWPLAILSTASGRVFGDVHWVTDTAAGVCLGASIVSAFLMVSTALDRRKQG